MTLTKVFLDTSGLAAFVNRDDEFHERAMACSETLTEAAVFFVTTYAILTETADLLAVRMKTRGRLRMLTAVNAAVEFVSTLESAGYAQVIQVDSQLWQKAWQLMQHMTDKSWGLTDCISFVVMKEHGIHIAFTADRHFEQAGFERLLHD
jgi:uncharacterized protein